MPKIVDVVESTLDDDAFLAKMARRHEARLLSSIGKLRDNITTMVGSLETTPAGRLRGVKVNLKQVQQLHKKIINEFQKQYGKDVDKMLGDFSDIGEVVEGSYRHLGEAARMTGIDKTMMDTLRDQTYSRYMEFGDSARDRIARSMYDSVVAGDKFSTLANTIRGILTGHKDVRGRSMTTYAKGFANDAIMNFHNQVNVKKGEDLGMTHFLYYGSLITTSRPFCITRAGKVYSKSKILAWDGQNWKGKSGPPLQERGGYNCRHSWRPVRPEWVKDDEGKPIPREEIVGYLHPATTKKTTTQIKKVEKQYAAGRKKMSGLQAKQKKYKAKKKAGKWTPKLKTEYTELRKEIVALRADNRVLADELKSLRGKVEKEGKKIIKKAKKTTVVKKAKPKAKVVKKKPLVVGGEEAIERTTKIIETDSVRITTWAGVSDDFIKENLEYLENVPRHIAQKVRKSGGYDIHIGKRLSQVDESLKGVRPRGWDPGSTWDEADGMVNTKLKRVIIAEESQDFGGFWYKAGKERRKQVFFHEFGHAVDESYDHFSESKSFIKAYNKDVKRIMNSGDADNLHYFLQEGYSGKQETFAQLFANIIGDVDYQDIVDHFPNTSELIIKRFDSTKKVTAKVVKEKAFKEKSPAWYKRTQKTWHKGLSKEEIAAIQDYTEDFGDQFGSKKETYRKINEHLRKGKKIDAEAKAALGHIDEALSKTVIDEDVLLYRGISDNLTKTLENSVGKTVLDKGLMSTTADIDQALLFADMRGGGLQVMRIRVPKGTNGGYLGFKNLSLETFDEAEVLLPRNTKVRVIGVAKDTDPDWGDLKYIDVEVIPDKTITKTVEKAIEETAEKRGVYWEGKRVGDPKILSIDHPGYLQSPWEREAHLTGQFLYNRSTGGSTLEKYFPRGRMAPLKGDTGKGTRAKVHDITFEKGKGRGIYEKDDLIRSTEYYSDRLFGDDPPKIVIRSGGHDPVAGASQAYDMATDTATITLHTSGGYYKSWTTGKKLARKEIVELHREAIAHELVHIQQKRMGRYKIVFEDYKPPPPMAEMAEKSSNYIRKDKKWYLKGAEVDILIARDLEKLKIPPAWKNVVVSTDPNAKVRAIGLDSAGRWQYRYSAKHIEEAKRKKFNNVKMFSKDMPEIRRKIEAGIRAGDDKAFLLELENKTAIRAGSNIDFKAKKKAYGLTTLLKEHVQIDGDIINLNFVAKKGVPASYRLQDKRLAEWLTKRKDKAKPGGRLFPDITARQLNRYLREISGKRYTIKDFRTYHGTRIAYEELKKYAGKSLTVSEKKSVVNQVSKKVAAFLQNTPAISRSAYIDPIVWEFIGGI